MAKDCVPWNLEGNFHVFSLTVILNYVISNFVYNYSLTKFTKLKFQNSMFKNSIPKFLFAKFPNSVQVSLSIRKRQSSNFEFHFVRWYFYDNFDFGFLIFSTKLRIRLAVFLFHYDSAIYILPYK